MKVLIYGASGYTAKLLLQFPVPDGQQWILAGRNKEALSNLASVKGLDYECFSVEESEKMHIALREVDVLLNLAGPYIHTAVPFMQACLETGTHYLDITGELEVFQWAAEKNDAALKAGIMLMPGCGFDVVATDAVAKFLSVRLPGAEELLLAFVSNGGMSRGTMRSALNKLGKAGAERKAGVLVPRPIGHKQMQLELGGKSHHMVSIPWADVVTAWYTTGIPDIVVYMNLPMRWVPLVLRIFGPMLRMDVVKQALLRKIDTMPEGPSPEALEKGKTLVYGKVKKGNTVLEAEFFGPQAYRFTALSCLAVLNQIMKSGAKPGFQTPAGCFGSEIAASISGCSIKLR